MSEADEAGVEADRVEVGLVGEEAMEPWVDLESLEEAFEGFLGVSGEAPIAGQVVAQERLAGMSLEGGLEHLDCLGEAVGAFVAPAEGDGQLDGHGAEGCGFLEMDEGFADLAEFSQGFTREILGFEGEAGPGLGAEQLQGPDRHVEH